jgi:membrane protein
LGNDAPHFGVVLHYKSQIQLVYGSLTTAIAVLLSVEIGALVLLVGAQVIAEYERISREPIETSGHSLKLEGPVERKQ